MVWTSKDGPKCPVSPADRGEFMKPTPVCTCAALGKQNIPHARNCPALTRPKLGTPSKPPADMRQIFSDGDNTHRFPKGR